MRNAIGRKLAQTKSQGDHMFEQSLLQKGKLRGSSFLASLLLQIGVVGIGTSISAVFFETLPTKELVERIVFLPSPPPPKAPAPPETTRTPHRRTLVKEFVFRAPTQIPREIPKINDEEFPFAGPEVSTSPRVPGALPCGPLYGISCPTETIQGEIGPVVPPPAPPQTKTVEAPKPKEPLRVGGVVQAANLIHQPRPPYPPLARAARIQGVVRFTAIIGKDGTIQNLRLVSGPPLLVQAAMDAVKQWRYKPTLLNNEPTEVITQIDVNFTLTI